jgi:hypothetical protein
MVWRQDPDYSLMVSVFTPTTAEMDHGLPDATLQDSHCVVRRCRSSVGVDGHDDTAILCFDVTDFLNEKHTWEQHHWSDKFDRKKTGIVNALRTILLALG